MEIEIKKSKDDGLDFVLIAPQRTKTVIAILILID
jgi:hypothetical protein